MGLKVLRWNDWSNLVGFEPRYYCQWFSKSWNSFIFIEVVYDSVFNVASLKQWQEALQIKPDQMYQEIIDMIITELCFVKEKFIIASENSIILTGTSAGVQSVPPIFNK